LLLDKKDPKQALVFESIQSLFYIRNGLEHHKGIAKQNRILTYRRLSFVTTSGKEVKELGPLPLGEGLKLTAVDDVIAYDEGEKIRINKEQLKDIAMNLFTFSIDSLKISATKKRQ